MKCQIDECRGATVGEILVCVINGDPWYIKVCEKHLKARQKISPNGAPLVNSYPQWKLNEEE